MLSRMPTRFSITSEFTSQSEIPRTTETVRKLGIRFVRAIRSYAVDFGEIAGSWLSTSRTRCNASRVSVVLQEFSARGKSA